QTGIVVTPGAAVVLSVTGFPTAAVSGFANTFTVSVRDAYGNLVTGYRGTVHVESSDLAAALPDDYTFTAADAGTHIFGAALYTVGAQSITVTDTTATFLLTGSQLGIKVTPRFFVVTDLPSAVRAGDTSPFTVTAYDVFGNVATGYRGTVHFTSSDAQAGLP